ncbi:MAG TPA: kinase [Lysobacter sp.]|nr:kinase [Lysobacter sp.]
MGSPSHPFPSPGYAAPLVEALLDDALDHGCRVYALAGLQGTGKSTLAGQLVAAAAARGLRAVALSIDDFYLDRPQRQALGRDVHPLLTTRGPPGTHEVALACEVLDGLRDGRTVALPRFDKIADVRLPQADWPRAGGVDLVVFEGWFQKVPPQDATALHEPVNALEHDEDPDGVWRTYCNAALADAYPPLWQRLDRLTFLQGPGFEVVSDWRWQQEQTLQAQHPDRRTMTRPQVLRFIQLFERVSRHALQTLPTIADSTIALDARRTPLGVTGALSTRLAPTIPA